MPLSCVQSRVAYGQHLPGKTIELRFSPLRSHISTRTISPKHAGGALVEH
jgi:hypothetical protein